MRLSMISSPDAADKMMTEQTNPCRQGSPLTVSDVKRIHGKAILILSNGEMLSMPRAMLKERPYRTGMSFDRRLFEDFLKERAYPFAMEKAVTLLASRARTEKEIVQALRMNAYPDATIARVMQRLSKAGYVDDKDFAVHTIKDLLPHAFTSDSLK